MVINLGRLRNESNEESGTLELFNQFCLPLSRTRSFFLSLPLVSGAFKCICDLVMGDSGSLLNPFSIAGSLHLSPWPAVSLPDEGWDLCSRDWRKDKRYFFSP